MTVRRKLVLWIVGLMGVAIAAACAATVLLLKSQLVGDLDDRLDQRARVAQEFFRNPPTDAAPPPDIVGFRFIEFDTAIVVLNNDGEISLSAPSGTTAEPDPLPDLGELDPSDVLEGRVERLTVDALGGSEPHYRALATRVDPDAVLVLAAPLESIVDTIRTALITLVIAGIVTVAVLSLLIWLVVRRSFRPLDEMVSTAATIAGGDLSARARLSNERDEVGRLGAALNAMLDQIESASAARRESQEELRRFVADASHELRTPLTTIRGYAELWRQGADSAEQTQTAMTRIEHEAVRMTALVEDLLLLARLNQNRPMSREPVDVAPLAEDAVAGARAIEPERPIELDFADAGPFVVQGDATRLRQTFDNLLANIREHTAADASVSFRVSSAGSELTVEVADLGPGMSADDAERAFERFYQAAGSSARSGTGLGLAIVASIVEAHDGRVWLDSKLGAGTTVTITLPRS